MAAMEALHRGLHAQLGAWPSESWVSSAWLRRSVAMSTRVWSRALARFWDAAGQVGQPLGRECHGGHGG